MRTVLLLIALWNFLAPVVGGQESSKWRGRVKLDVVGEPSTVSSVSSYMNRELRALGDVVVTDDGPQYTMELIVGETRSGGYVFSIVTRSPFSTNLIRWALKDRVDQNLIEGIANTFTYAAILHNHWVRMGPKDSLESMCKDIVAKFDTDTLQESRHQWQRTVDAQKSREKQ